ncbi:exonuclease domain-containing protein [Clostridium botulinum D/C]|uniref:3'-5' exonuclease n=1 Tax=Clostridium botulinum TaxID=1491 RepID=UPI001E5A2F15|nr:3'-5' exonuclease [Clostridium botulinum]MCD3350328.1 exonuclease domain-containing protein [Clostridium botulinum D/C]MCD3359348.1 exonuclease domain-containing protein [Clostridium botulinum D/C]MCD3361582.1 exonuclease domain-containing protein [Clostridium botulinum D/C]MCD3365003.1 exonuclease domain-containing protein [Clostridium botulinum D/C]
MSFYLVKNEELIFVPYNLLAIDFEFITTKIIENKAKKYFQEIIEIGAVFKSENLCEKYSKIIKPRYFFNSKDKSKSSYGGRFSYADIQNGLELDKVFEDLKKLYVEKETIWMSWGKAEYDILKTVCKKYDVNLPFLKEDYLDLSLEFKKFFNINQNISLDKALTYLDIPIVNRHYALPDAEALMKIIYVMFQRGYRLQDKDFKIL